MQAIRKLLTSEEDKDCWAARKSFYAQLESSQPSYYWKSSEEGDQYLRPEVFDKIQKLADDHFIECAVKLIAKRLKE